MNRPNRRAVTNSPLTNTQLQVSITDLVAEYELRHQFTNDGTTAIEAVYSFPVPLDSAFLGMEAILAGETLVAKVIPARSASRQYDDAIAEGNSAVLLERLEPGMLCVNLGNLMPNEQGEIVLRFAAPLHAADNTVRFSLPLVHRPRYGRSRLDEVAEPGNDFAIEHPLQATVRVNGLLAATPVHCATHGARFAQEDGSLVLHLSQAMLDRDLVLRFELPLAPLSQGRLVADGDQSIGILSFSTPANAASATPTDFCLLLDGSGSMTGDAILQSRQALNALAATIGDEDRVQVLRFGSTTVPMFRRPLKGSLRVREALQSLSDTVDSDLGGTEIGHALDSALDALNGLESQGRSQAIILVTDGAVQPQELIVAKARAADAGIRIFVVAVGSSAGADVLAPLAESTRAVMERAVPAEPIDACVMRQVRRARETVPLHIEVDWGSSRARPLPLAVAYPGDTIIATAFLPLDHQGAAQVVMSGQEGMMWFTLNSQQPMPALRAVVGAQAYQHASEAEREEIALRYSLITTETSAVLVKTRLQAEQADGLPIIKPVRHMRPAGMVANACLAYRNVPMEHDLYSDFSDDYAKSHSKNVVACAGYIQHDLDLNDLSLRSSKELPSILNTLSPARIDEIKQQLMPLLEEWLFADQQAPVTLRELLQRLEPGLLQDALVFVGMEGIDADDDPGILLELLAEECVGGPLSDDLEAWLAERTARICW